MRDFCGGCVGMGSHWRWCPEAVGRTAHLYGVLSEKAESLGDQVGGNDPGVANMLYAAGAQLRQRALEAKENYRAPAE